MAATLSQLFVGLFNAATGAYANQFKTSDANSLASVVSLVAGKDLSNDTNYINYVLENMGVTTSSAVYSAAFTAMQGLVTAQGRGNAVLVAVDFLQGQSTVSSSPYYAVATSFVAKVAKAEAFTAGHPWESNVSTLVGSVTGTGTGTALTTGDDLLTGTSVNDIFSSLAGSLATADKVLDSSTTDSDALTIGFKTGSDMTVQPTVTNVESITVNYTGLTGAALDATNISGSTITYNLTAPTTDGIATVSVAGNNNVTAGTGVTKLAVTGLKGGVVDAKQATTVEVATVAIATNTTGATVKVHGNTALKLSDPGSALAVVAIDADVASKVTISNALGGAGTSDLVIGSGAGEVTVKSTSALLKTIETFKVAGLEISTNTANDVIDLTSSTVTTINSLDTESITLDNLKAGTVNVKAAAATLIVSGKETASSATVNLEKDTPTLTVDTGGTYTVNAGAAVETITSLTYAGTTTLNVVGDVAITTLAAPATTDKVVIAGTGNVTATGTWTESYLDASGLNGKLTATQSTAVATTVLGGTGADTIEIINTTETAAVTTGAGDDTVNFSGEVVSAKLTATTGDGADTVDFADLHSLAAATLTVSTGAGDDTIELGSAVAVVTAATDKITIDGGDGVDTLSFITAADFGKVALTTGAIKLTNIEQLKIVDIEIGQALLNGKTFTVVGSTGASDELKVVADAAVNTLDLSNITADASLEKTTFVASAQTSAMTITGTNGVDEVTLTGFADVVNTGAGKDKVTMDTACASATVNLGDAADTLVFIGSSTATDKVTVTGGAGADTLDLSDMVIADTNTFVFADFAGGSGGDKFKIDISGLGVDGYTATDASNVVTIVSASMAVALGAAMDNGAGGGGNYVIFDTAANILAADIETAMGGSAGLLAIASDTGAVYADADGDFTGSAVKIGSITLTGTLTTDNFTFVA